MIRTNNETLEETSPALNGVGMSEQPLNIYYLLADDNHISGITILAKIISML